MTDPNHVADAKVEQYAAVLMEHHRPPSKGGNTSALHAHYLTIDGVTYSFLARGSRKWVYKSDTVSFNWELKDGKYRNIIKESLVTRDKHGEEVVRGDRRYKPMLRSAPTRLPVSRREQRG